MPKMDSTINTGKRKSTNIIPFFLLTWIITFLVFLPALKNGFVGWDDHLYVVDNLNIRSLDIGFIKWAFSSVVAANWHPVTMLSHAIDYSLYGLSPRGHHLTNIILHACNASLVFLLAQSLITRARTLNIENPTGRAQTLMISLGALGAALLFGTHPIHVESVAWISERKDLLCAFFFLLSTLTYIRYSTTASNKITPYALSLLFFLLALMSKPMAISLPLVFIIIDFYPLGRGDSLLKIKKNLLEKIPFFALAISFSLLTLKVQAIGGAVASLGQITLFERILVSVRAFTFYLYKIFLPIKLTPLYPYPEDITLFSFASIGSIIVLALITIAALYSLKKHRALFALWAYYVITLLPVIGIVQVGAQAAADRYTYLPGISIFMIAGALLTSKALHSRLSKNILILFTIILCTVLSYKTIIQTAVWKNSFTLWGSVIEEYPNEISGAYYNRGIDYLKIGEKTLAIEDFNDSIRLNPSHVDSYNNRGVGFAMRGDFQRAITDFRIAATLDPESKDAYKNLSRAYTELGDSKRAEYYRDKVRGLNTR